MKKNIVKRVLCTVLATTLLFGSTPAIQSEAASRKPITGKITKAERVAVDKIKVTVKLNNKKAKIKRREIKDSELGKYFSGYACVQYTFLKNNGRVLDTKDSVGSKVVKITNYKNGTFSVTLRDKRFQKMRNSKNIRVDMSIGDGKFSESGYRVTNSKKVTYDKRKFKVVKKLVVKAGEGTEFDGTYVTHCYACGKNFNNWDDYAYHTTMAKAALRAKYPDLEDFIKAYERIGSNSTTSCVSPKHATMAVSSENKEAVYDYIWKKK